MSITLNGEPVLPPVECDACQRQVPAESVNTTLCDGGLLIDPHDIGYYGGYLDFSTFDEIGAWKLCRDCTEKFFDTFPALRRKIQEFYAND